MYFIFAKHGVALRRMCSLLISLRGKRLLWVWAALIALLNAWLR